MLVEKGKIRLTGIPHKGTARPKKGTERFFELEKERKLPPAKRGGKWFFEKGGRKTVRKKKQWI